MLEKIHALSGNQAAQMWWERILAELRFAYTLSKAHENQFDDLLIKTEQTICEAIEKQKTITQDIVYSAEEMLSPLAPLAKSYRVMCAAHAHIDMNWKWGYDETVAVVEDTFRTMLDIMDEYPGYKFSQSQAAVYKIIEEHCPDMLEEIKRRIHEGRWEVTASAWVENDTNMPSGESLARHILYTKQYLSALLDIDPDFLNIAFQPDTFGHTVNLPELLSQSGIQYYYHCRGKQDGAPLFRWQSPSGAEIVVYRDFNFYNSYMGTDAAEQTVDLARLTGSKTVLRVYGVGDHGGGPTRRDIERIQRMDGWPIYPAFQCATFKDYFDSIQEALPQRPVETGESNFIFDGCYTSQSIIKQGNRESERLLYDSELLAAFSSLSAAYRYDPKSFAEAWQKVLFNQFHDIITGSCVQASRQFAMGEYQRAGAIATSNKKQAVKAIIDQIDTSALLDGEEITVLEPQSDGAGSGSPQNSGGAMGKSRIFHLFNTAVCEKKGLCEILVWDYEGDMRQVQIRDSAGRACRFQIVGEDNYWWHHYTKILVEVMVPACGYETVVLTEQVHYDFQPAYMWEMRVQKEPRFILENEKIRVTFNTQNAAIDSIVDKESGEELVDVRRGGAGFRFFEEVGSQPTPGFSSMSAWFVGRYKTIESVHRDVEIQTALSGELRNAIQFSTTFRGSNLTVVVSLDKDSTHLDFDVTCDWREFGTATSIPALGFFLPLAYPCDSYIFDIPFGLKARGPMDIDRPANRFVRAKGAGSKELMLISKTKYGYRCDGNAVGLNLIRGTTDPDRTPEIGTHHIEFCVQVMEREASGKAAIDAAQGYCHPLLAFAGKKHAGAFPVRQEYLRQSGDGVSVSGVKMSEDGGSLLLRLYETEGKASKAEFRFFRAPKAACFVDATEQKELEGLLQIQGDTLAVSMSAYHVAAVKVTF